MVVRAYCFCFECLFIDCQAFVVLFYMRPDRGYLMIIAQVSLVITVFMQ